jgi:predicted metal-dependent peptidase
MHNEIVKLKKAHIRLINHPETCLYAGVLMLGTSEVVDDEAKCPTAYTDGKNKKYGRKFLESLTVEKVAALALHENLHVMLRHLSRHEDLNKLDARLANEAMDYVVNSIIVDLKDKTLCKLPDGGLYDPKYRNWSVRQVFDDLKKNQQQQKSGNTLDNHGFGDLKEGELVKLGQQIDEAIQHGMMLAGRLGSETPRAIRDLVTPRVDWKAELWDFFTSTTSGRDEMTWRKLNRKRLIDDIYMPSVKSDRLDEVVIAIDTSGSISGDVITQFASELANICETCNPDRVRVLWWDTEVVNTQVFEGGYAAIRNQLKPAGGGGTRVGCVADYITKHGLNPECLVVLTDGYVEDNVRWGIDHIPTLWLVTEAMQFTPPSGRKVKIEK